MNNPLTNVLTPKARAILYAVLFVASLGITAWQAAGGDWFLFAAGVVTTLFAATAASNASVTPTDTSPPVDVEPEPGDLDDEDDPSAWLPETDAFHGGTGSSFPESNDYGYRA